MKGLTGIGDGTPIGDLKVHSADAKISEVFTFKMLEGSPTEFGVEGNTALISRSTAQRFFGVTSPPGRRQIFLSNSASVLADLI